MREKKKKKKEKSNHYIRIDQFIDNVKTHMTKILLMILGSKETKNVLNP